MKVSSGHNAPSDILTRTNEDLKRAVLNRRVMGNTLLAGEHYADDSRCIDCDEMPAMHTPDGHAYLGAYRRDWRKA